MTSAKNILTIATREIGYSRWNDPQPGTKYGRDYATRHGKYYGKNGVPYCAMFITWVFRQCGVIPPGGDFAYCPAGIKAMKKLGLEVDTHDAQPGDIVFFDWDGGESDHVGIVEHNLGNALQTIEGNTTVAWKPGAVGRRTRSFSVVCNVFRPQYDQAPPAIDPKGKSLRPEQRKENPKMIIFRAPNGTCYLNINNELKANPSASLLKGLQDIGVPVLNLSDTDLEFLKPSPDLSAVPQRVRNLLDAITDSPKMPAWLRQTSVLAKIQAVIGIPERQN